MGGSRKVWVAIYLVAFVIFVGGLLLRINETPYFPAFVGFCMLYALATNVYWWRTRPRR